MPTAGPDFNFQLISQGLIDYMNTRQQIIDLRLALGGLCRWFPGTPDQASTSYPANPYLQCPRLLLVGEQGTLTPQALSGGFVHHIQATVSLFYYQRQVVGQSHQEIMKGKIDSICTPFSRDKLLPPNLSSGAVRGFVLEKCLPGLVTFHPDLQDEFEDPNLTVSVAQVNFIIEGKTCVYETA